MKAIRLFGVFSALGSLFSFSIQPAAAAPIQTLHGNVPTAVARLQPLGRLPDTNRLQLAIALPLRYADGLTNLLRQIYDPASPNFHHYLTPQQFAERFGPTEADYEAVAAFAKANGLQVTATHPNRVLLDVNGSVADVERALHIKLNTFRHPTENRTFFAADSEPTLDLAVPILHISGLDNYSLPRPRLVVNQFTNGWGAQPNSGSGPTGGYMGKDFRVAYVPDTTLNGTGQTVGLLQFDGYTASDITYYENLAGLPNVPLQNVLVDGASGAPSGTGGEVEVSLDIEMAISMATNLSKVIVYEAPNPSPFVDLLSQMADDNLAKQLSCSWYEPNGPAEPAADIIFQQMAAQGQSFFSASGDYDAFTGLIPFPGDTPYITEVGGTTLTTTGAGGSYASETVWNRGGGIGSGGGISTQYAIPSWQTNINMSGNQGSTTMRNVPDVALTAENVYVRADGADQNVGGTSCAAPLWAGFMALVNQQAATVGQSPAGFINPAVYAIGTSANYTSLFHDTTTGNNTSPSSPTKFYATTGYDLCTGWGTPAGQGLINALVPPVAVILPASAMEGDGLLAGAGHVQLPTAPPTNVTVTLNSGDPAQVSVPATVTVLAGNTNAAFDLTILDDGVLDGTQIATVSATVPGMGTGSGSMTIYDKETATLQVLLPAAVTKGQGAVSGTVQVSLPVGANVAVSVSSDNTNLIQVPATVTIPNGQTSTVFTATILTDGQINNGKGQGPQTVHVTAHVQNWTDGVAAVTMRNNTNLTVTLPGSVWENAGVQTNAGSVRQAGTAATATVVSLASSNPSKLMVPATVTIPAGSLSNTFNLTPVDDALAEGHQLITVTASATGFTNGSASMWVLDKETPVFPFNPRPGNLAMNVLANTNLTWSSSSNFTELIQNGGFETGTLANWTQVPNSLYGGQFYTNNGTLKPFSPDPAMPPYAGSYDAVADEYGPGIFYMYQTVSIPANVTSATLSWAHRVRNFYSAFSASQQFQVRICDPANNVLATPFTTSPGDPLLGDWVQESCDLTAFAGQTVRVEFWVNSQLYYIDAHVDNVSLQVSTPDASGSITNDVYFGTNPAPGPAEYQGSTTNTAWTLPLLSPLTTYYWQIVAHRGGSATGAVWQFTTAGVDHFAWNAIPTPQFASQPFGVTITAEDAFNSTVSNFTGAVALQGAGNGSPSSQLIIFDDLPGDSLPVPAGYGGLTWSNFVYGAGASHSNSGYAAGTISLPNMAFNAYGTPANLVSTGQWNFVSAYLTAAWNDNLQVQVLGYTGAALIYSNTCTLSATTPTLINFNYLGVTSVGFNSFGGTPHSGYSGRGTHFVLDNVLIGGSAASPVSIAPTNSPPFINGSWTGSVTVLQPANNVVLVADDGNQHTGASNPFDVVLTNDLSVSIADSPHPVSVGANLTYTLTIANTGPADSTGVMVTNFLPAGAAFVSATSSQGTCAQNGGLVTCNLGTVPGATNATVTIVVVPSAAGLNLTNVATVSRAEPESYLANNTTAAITPVTPPAISIADAACLEGNVGTTNLTFAVTLAVPSAQTITVAYATSDGTATAGGDYIATNGILTFPPGTTNETISVAVIGDIQVESNEMFFVTLTNPVNGVLARAQATGTILNDDGLPGDIYYLVWSAIASPQIAGQPFPVTLTALDYSNNVATNFNGVVALSAGNETISPTNSDNFTNGVWNGSMTVPQHETNLVLRADDGNGHVGLSNPFVVALTNTPPVILVQPTNQIAIVSSNVTFSVVADGTPPLAYQWSFNGTNVTGATNATLALPNVQLTNAGVYAVAVTNNYGSTTSSNAMLNVYAIPVIKSFSPQTGFIGTTVNILGLNFDSTPSNNVVYFGGVQAVVQAASTTNLAVSVPVGATYRPITETVGGLTAYSPMPFLPTFSSADILTNSSLGPQISLPSLSGIGDIVFADMDGDGKPDLVMLSGYGPVVSIYRNISTNGTLNAGSFAPRVDLPIGNNMSGVTAWVTVADINGDGKQDIIVANANTGPTNGTVSIIQNFCTPGNLASNLFGAPVNFTVALGSFGVAVRDLDGDGKPDIVTANYDSTTISVLRNIGSTGLITTNSFAPAVHYVGAPGTKNLAIADMDGDGKPDVVTVDEVNGGSEAVSVFRNVSTVGNIAFAPRVDFSGLTYCYNVALGDMDGDGKLDVVVSSFAIGQSVSVYRNTSVPGSIAFAPEADFALGGWGNSVTVGDLDGDGKPDVAAVTQSGNALSLFRNISTPGSFTSGSLAARLDFASGSNPYGVAIGDLDGDGRPDTAFANNYGNTISIYQNVIPFSGPPVITMQPANQTAVMGGTATFSVSASGTQPLAYQWNFGGTNLPAATNASLTLTNLQYAQAGAYFVQVTNAFGTVASSNAVLTVMSHPPIAVPDSVAFLVGTPLVSFNVLSNDTDPNGDPLTVQSFTLPARGTLTQINNGQFTYQPNTAFTSGQDQFTYTVTNSHGGTASAPVTIIAYAQNLAGGDWPTFGNGPSHTGYYPGMLGGSTLVAGWSTNFGSPLNQVAVGGGNVYVTPVTYFGATYLTALNAVSGQPAWQYNFASVFSINPPTFDNGLVYVQLGKGISGPDPQLSSFNAADGALLWSASFGAQWERYYAPTVYGDGIWVDGGYYGGMYGFSTNGTQRFFNGGLEQYDQWTPTYYQGTVYSWVAGNFRAHDPLTGTVLWSASFGWNWDGWSMNTVAAIDGGRAFVQQRPNLIAIDLATHTNAWTVGGGVKGSPAVANGIVYAIIGDGVQAFSAQNGVSLGVYEATNDTGVAWQPIVTDDSLFVASSSSTYVFDLASHQLLQTIPYGGTLSIANGWLYIAGSDGWLRAYTVSSSNSPKILTQPVSQTVAAGGTATFSVSAGGTPPLTYQWKMNGTNIIGATGTNLTIVNVQITNAGLYSVAITNAYGFITSSNALLTVNSPSSCDPAPSGIVAWWPGEANANDIVGGNNGTLGSGVGFTNGEVGQAFFFNGTSSSYVSVADSPSLDALTKQITVELWLKANQTNANASWAGIATKGNATWRLQGVQGAKTVYFAVSGTSGDDVTGTRNVNDGQWHHVAGVYDGTNILIYVDGTLDVSKPSTGLIFTNNSLLGIGYNTQGCCGSPDYYFNGLVDEVSIYNRGLSAGEIAAIYNAGSGGKCPAVPPSILAQPANQAAVVGGAASFSVSAVGMQPLFYQWNFNGTNILGATNTSLTLVNVQPTNAGPYSVTVTNLYGSTNSVAAMLTVNPPPPCDPAPSGIVAWWPGEGNANDIVGGNNGTLTNGAGYSTGEVGQAFNFDGTSGYAIVPSSPSLKFTNAFTAEAWVNYNTTGNPLLEIVSKGQDVNAPEDWHMQINNGQLHADVNAGGVWNGRNFTTALVPGVWYHLAVTYDGSSLKGYVNGALDGSIAISGSMQATDYALRIGSYAPINGSPANKAFFPGRIDELSLYNRALSSNEIAAIYNAGSGGKCPPTPPFIAVQPTNQTVVVGGTATFNVTAGGTSPLTYQWKMSGTNITGATGTNLTIVNVQFTNAGLYSVIITNAYGSVISSNALLTVNPAPLSVPVITAFNPQSGALGAAVNITGLNFSPVNASNTVYFGAVRAVVSAASTTNLVVSVPAGATFAPITETVGGLTAYSPMPFLPTFPNGGVLTNSSFGSQITLPSGNSPGIVVIADFDGDGKPDLAVNTGDNNIYVYRNISTNSTLAASSFASPVILPLGSGSEYDMVAADVDGDGKQDLILQDYSANQAMVLQNFSTPGNISFGSRVSFTVASGPVGVAVRDLDGDGKPEIVTANQGSGTISVLRNIGTNGIITTNSFAPAVSFTGASNTKYVAIADLDGDGQPDVVTVNEVNSTANAVSVYRNISTLGNIAFASRIDFPGPIYSYKPTIGDIDGDGKLDVVFVSFATGQSVSVYRNISTPGSFTTNSFAPRIDFNLGGWGNWVALGDLDGDGKPDVAAVTQAGNALSLFRNISTPGSFTNTSLAARLDFASGSNPTGVAIGDLDGDGKPDIVFANQGNNTLSIYQNITGAKPFIVSQPASQTNFVGTTATFAVTAGGSMPLTYQWKQNGTNLIGATGTNLIFVNVQFTNAGLYSVAVTNAFGSVVSSNAVLVVNPFYHFVWNAIPSPRFAGAPFAVVIQAQNPTNGPATNFTDTVTFVTTNGLQVVPSVSGNFIQGVWTGAVAVVQTGTNVVLQATDNFGETGLANPINIVGLPSLMAGASSGTLLIAWPDNLSGFILETTPGLSPATWVPVSAPPLHFGGQYFQPIPMTDTNAFYRLRFTGQ